MYNDMNYTNDMNADMYDLYNDYNIYREVQVYNTTDGNELHKAVYEGDKTTCRKLLTQGIALHTITYHGYTPIHIAAQCGHKHIMELFIELGIDINCLTPRKQNCLHIAITHRTSNSFIEFLIRQGIDINSVDHNTKSILTYVFIYNSDLLDLFVRYNVNFNDINAFNAFLRYSDNYTLPQAKNIIKLFVDSGLNINNRDYLGHTPLYITTEKPHMYSFVVILLELGADVNQLFKYRYSLGIPLKFQMIGYNTLIMRLCIPKLSENVLFYRNDNGVYPVKDVVNSHKEGLYETWERTKRPFLVKTMCIGIEKSGKGAIKRLGKHYLYDKNIWRIIKDFL